MVARGAGRSGYPWPSGQVAHAADGDLPVRRDDQKVGIEGEVAQGEARFGGRGTRGVVLGEDDVQVAEAHFGYGGHAAVRSDGLQHAQPAGIDHPEALLSCCGR